VGPLGPSFQVLPQVTPRARICAPKSRRYTFNYFSPIYLAIHYLAVVPMCLSSGFVRVHLPVHTLSTSPSSSLRPVLCIRSPPPPPLIFPKSFDLLILVLSVALGLGQHSGAHVTNFQHASIEYLKPFT